MRDVQRKFDLNEADDREPTSKLRAAVLDTRPTEILALVRAFIVSWPTRRGPAEAPPRPPTASFG